jgi:thiosulfate/3-mercaptopyruvate sulfurtransferase
VEVIVLRPLLLGVPLLAGLAPLASAQLPTGPQLLVNATWLDQHLHDSDLVILTVGPDSGYAKEHIPGSRFIRLEDVATPESMRWPAPAGTLGLQMASEDALREAFEHLGISNTSRVVVVADSDWDSPSTRVVLTLGYVGLGDRTYLLDGGMTAWRKQGLPVTARRPPVPPGHLTTTLLPSIIVDAEYVSAHEHAAHVKLIDARDSVFYSGPGNARVKETGHVPGAASLPFGSLIEDDSNLFLPTTELERRFRTAGVQPGDTVVAYCHVGQQATVVLFAARLLGHPVKLYDGSFEDWKNRKLPIEGGQ